MNENENKDEDEKKNLEYKIITLGDSSVGKTSIINRFINDIFDEDIDPTLGIKHNFKILEINDKKMKLSLIDTNGQEKYRALSVSYFRHAHVVLFIFNLNDPLSFNNIQDWINTFNDNNNKKVILKYLIGNKNDLEQRVEQNLIDEFAKNNNVTYMSTSAKTNSQINELFQMIGEELLEEEEKKTNNSFRSKSSRTLSKRKDKSKKKCC